MGDEFSKHCSGCGGAGIAVGLFSLGLFFVIGISLVLIELFWSIAAIVVLILSLIILLFILVLIWQLVRACVSKRRGKH
ncbi:hypothetical protein WAK64_16845 [Bacillus spongiae]|uniref:Transmembrane protein n=1 Tax=Bacillus spongiae TaxID=2683610 RepID=A0ABU8HHF2_9BACI